MKIYVAGSFVDRDALRPEAARLWSLGHEITGSWLNEVARPADMSHEDFMKKIAMKDIAEVCMADLIIIDNRRSSGGKNCEWGVSLGQFQKKQLWLIGDESNVFHYLADKKFANWDSLIEHIGNGKDVTNYAV